MMNNWLQEHFTSVCDSIMISGPINLAILSARSGDGDRLQQKLVEPSFFDQRFVAQIRDFFKRLRIS
jgi:hypothetical protein